MAIGPIKSRSVGTKWVVELYPFESSVPEAGQLGSSAGPAAIIGNATASKEVSGLINGLKISGKLTGETENSLGITSISYSRSKATPDSNCTISLVGRIPKAMHVGSWAIVSSVSTGVDGKTKILTRFIGQVLSIDSTYQVTDSALVAQNSIVTLREWSSMLRMPVRYDIFSIEANAEAASGVTNLLGKALSAATSISGGSEAPSYKEITQLLEKSFDPFEFANIILMLIGTLNKEDGVGVVSSVKDADIKLPKKAVSAPGLPKGIQERLGLVNSGNLKGTLGEASKIIGAKDISSQPLNPFMSGFMQTVTGIQSEPIYNSGDWGGVFSETKISAYKGIMKKGYENNKIRPSTPGMLSILQSGASAWELLSMFCDNAMNEIYTDIWYEYGAGATDIVGRPVVVVRDKPFLMKKIKSGKIKTDVIGEKLNNWTFYDDIPRVNIPSELITNFKINNTSINSPNYIRVNYSLMGTQDKTLDAMAVLSGIKRLSSEMDRFGGNEHFVSTSFLAKDYSSSSSKNSDGSYFQEWFEIIRELQAAWHSYNYRMGNGVLVIKDNNIPISVGFNIQFKFGEFDLVGHVDSINSVFAIGGDGLETTTTTITLSRIVLADFAGDLDFIDPTHFGSLTKEKPVTGKSVGSLAGNISSSTLDKLKGLV